MLRTDHIETLLAAANSFAAVRLDLIEQDKARGGDGRLRDCEAALGDDHETILLFTDYGDDARTLMTTFALPGRIREEDFNAQHYRDLLET